MIISITTTSKTNQPPQLLPKHPLITTATATPSPPLAVRKKNYLFHHHHPYYNHHPVHPQHKALVGLPLNKKRVFGFSLGLLVGWLAGCWGEGGQGGQVKDEKEDRGG